MIALVLIHNHRYDGNLSRLDALYRDRFDRIWHLMPFYEGVQKNVIPIYENSFHFQGYIAQGWRWFEEPSVSHYCFVADDLLLHPAISAKNLCAELGIGAKSGFFERLRPLHEEPFWGHTQKAFALNEASRGSEAARLLPPPEEVEARLKRHGLSSLPVPGRLRFRPPSGQWWSPRFWLSHWHYRRAVRQNYPLPYPFIGSYADYAVVPASALARFAHYCGLFASMRLFVEIALPTTLLLAVDEIATLKPSGWRPGAMWKPEEVDALGSRYAWDLDRMLDDFPAKQLYFHPIKLSRWKSADKGRS